MDRLSLATKEETFKNQKNDLRIENNIQINYFFRYYYISVWKEWNYNGQCKLSKRDVIDEQYHITTHLSFLITVTYRIYYV